MRVAKAASRLPRFPIILVAAVSLLALALTLYLYSPSTTSYFPKRPEEFRTPAERLSGLASAQADLQKDPENIDAHLRAALAFFEGGPEEYLKALEALEKARELGALDERLFYYAAVMYEEKGLPDYAMADFERYLRHRPGDVETRARLANLYERTGEGGKAVNHYRKILEERPGDPVTLVNLATAHRGQEQWAEGLALLKPLLQKGSPMPEGGVRILGDLYRGAGIFQEALPFYLQEWARAKDDKELAKSLALTYEGLKDYEPALTQWNRLLELDPKNREAKNRIFLLKRKLKNRVPH